MPGPRYANSLITQEQTVAVPCPKCGAKPGETCRELQGRAQNHMERVRAARRKDAERRR